MKKFNIVLKTIILSLICLLIFSLNGCGGGPAATVVPNTVEATPTPSPAQPSVNTTNIILEGRIYNKNNDSSIGNAYLLLNGQQELGISDTSGIYKIQIPINTITTVQVTHELYKSTIIAISPTTSNLKLDVPMVSKDNEDLPIIISPDPVNSQLFKIIDFKRR